MAGELQTLEALAERTGLLAWPGDRETAIRNVAKFTRWAAWELREQSYGNVHKPGGENVDGLDVDKIMNRVDGRVYDIVVDAGIPRQRVGFNHADTLPPDRWANPVKPDGGTVAPPPPPPPPPPDGDLYVATLMCAHDLINFYGLHNAPLPAPDALAAEARAIVQAVRAASEAPQ